MSPKPQVFLSYAREDRDAVRDIYGLLQGKGFRPWMDAKDIGAGEDWQLSIKRAIRHSSFFLACVSQNSVSKKGVLQDEIGSAVAIRRENLEGETYLIPVRLDATELPAPLGAFQAVDYFEPEGEKRLLAALGYHRGRLWMYAMAALAVLIAAAAVWLVRGGSATERFVAARRADRAAAANSPAFVGITFWEVRPAVASDPKGVRMIVHPEEPSAAGPIEWTPVRISAAPALRYTTKFRVGIESSRSGYLYVADQEEYGDGSLGEPSLVFPTRRIRGGDNAVRGGEVIELPAADSRPPYWVFQSARGDYRGERITVAIVPRPIGELVVGDQPVAIKPSLIEEWRKNWSTPVRRIFEQGGGAVPTPPEVSARNDATRRLGPGDPPPGMIFEASAKPGAPFIVPVSLRVVR